VNGLCPECGNPPQYHSFCTLCCQLFRQPREAQPRKPKPCERQRIRWNALLRAEIAGLSADGLTAEKIAELMGLATGRVQYAMTYYGLSSQPPGRRKALEAAS
jgi:hypothetical protein